MIYRILADSGAYVDPDDRLHERVVWQASGSNMGGVSRARTDWADLPSPRIRNPRARFWFTEDGWKRYGRRVYEVAVQNGHKVRIVQDKNPEPSRVIYRDRWQVAILPPRPSVPSHPVLRIDDVARKRKSR